jgi:hypothetical protein
MCHSRCLPQVLLRDVAQQESLTGVMHPFPPSNYPASASYDWAVQWVKGLYEDYLWSGSTARVVAYWPQLTAFWANALSNVDSRGVWYTNDVLADIRCVGRERAACTAPH